MKQRLWAENSDFFERYEAFSKLEETKKKEASRESKVLSLKCFTVLKLIFEQRSYKSFEREMYYLHNTNVDVGTIDQSTYFVDRCLEIIELTIKDAARRDFCKLDGDTITSRL